MTKQGTPITTLLLRPMIFDYDNDDLFYLQLDAEEGEEKEDQDEHPSLTAAERNSSMLR